MHRPTHCKITVPRISSNLGLRLKRHWALKWRDLTMSRLVSLLSIAGTCPTVVS